MAHPSRPRTARTDRILPGVWRIRLPLPWDATPHGNAYAIADGDGIVLFDTGFGGSDGLTHLELGLRLAGFALDDITKVVCTHAHADHYGCAASIVERTGAPLWIHPAYDHVRGLATDFDAYLDERLELAGRNGVPEETRRRMAEARRGAESGFDGLVGPDVELGDDVTIETDLGTWTTHFAPGHAPSHVVFHQPERRILISGDVIVGRVFLFFDAGHTPDPVAEFLGSLDTLDGLDTALCLSGHGKPFREVPAKIRANRDEVARQLDAVRAALAPEPQSLYELVTKILGTDDPPPPALGYGMEMTTAYLTHLQNRGEASQDDSDNDGIVWREV